MRNRKVTISPLPPATPPPRMRGMHGLLGMVRRLPGLLLPPRGPAGENRRWGVVMGAIFAVIVAGAVGVGVVVELLAGNTGEGSAMEVARILPAIGGAYVVGGYLAGVVWDATRRIRHRFTGYVLRGGGSAAAMYAAMGLVLPLLDVDPLAAELYPFTVAGTAVLGALVGAGKWMKDRWMGDLPEPLREPDPA